MPFDEKSPQKRAFLMNLKLISFSTNHIVSHLFQQRKPITKLIPIWRFYWLNSVNVYSWHHGIHSHCQISRQRHVPKKIGSTWRWPYGKHTRLATFYVNLKRSKRKNGHYVFKHHKKTEIRIAFMYFSYLVYIIFIKFSLILLFFPQSVN